MVSIDIPKALTTNPSSHNGTPYLTINHEATVDLDSTNAFEGPEKLLEVWFSPSVDALPKECAPLGLKAVSAETWKGMLDLVHCQVLSVVESDNVDAYLLSESSMFVFQHKVILKTCGTTTLLYGLRRLLEIAAVYAGFPHSPANPSAGITATASPYRVFYSRKNFLYPNQQKGPHRSWQDEVRFLDRQFLGGSAYMIGKMNGEHWYLYITGPNTQLTPPPSPDVEMVGTETKFVNFPRGAQTTLLGFNEEEDDETLEVLMTDLDEQKARQFYFEDASAVAEGLELQQPQDPNQEQKGEKGEDDGIFDVFGMAAPGYSDRLFPQPHVEEPLSEGHLLGSVVSDKCGLSDVYPVSKYPDTRIDSYLFTPCGFSANGVVPAPVDDDDGDGAGSTSGKAASSASSTSSASKSAHYFTMHVTPEPQCSYASFETNVPARQSGRETADIVEQVIRIFRPGRFSVTLFEAKGREELGAPGAGEYVAASQMSAVRRTRRMECIEGYKRVDRIVHDLDGYELVFRYYERLDWKGGAPRLGEVQ